MWAELSTVPSVSITHGMSLSVCQTVKVSCATQLGREILWPFFGNLRRGIGYGT